MKMRKNIIVYQFYECKGIKFAVLNYTYGLNGLKLPQEYSYIVNLMDKQHKEKSKIRY